MINVEGSPKIVSRLGSDRETHEGTLGHHLPRIDALRAIAAISVLFFHLYTGVFLKAEIRPLRMLGDLRAHPGFLRWVAAPSLFGYAGVPLFFVISGFCIHYSYLQSRVPFSYLPFIGRRFWRIYPAYVAAMALSLLLPGNPIWKTHHLLKSLLLHLVFLHNFNQTTIFELIAPLWTLAVEFQFYAVYPLLLMLRNRFGMARAGLMSLALCAVISFSFHSGWIGHLQLPWLPIMYWVQWCLGAWVAERYAKGKSPLIPLPIAVLIWIVGILFAVPVATYGEWNYLAWAVLCASVIEWWLRRDASTIPPRLFSYLVWVGTISYSVYLLHALVLNQVLPRLPIEPETRFAWSLVTILPLTLVIGATSYYLIERPGIMMGRKIIALCFTAQKVEPSVRR